MGRISKEDEARIIEGYHAWDPDEMSVAELAESLGTTRQTLYAVLNRNGIQTKRAEDHREKAATPLEREMAAIAFKSVMDDLIGCRIWANEVAEALVQHFNKAGSADAKLRELMLRRP